MAELEAKVAYFCLHASRLFHQIKAFNESMHTTPQVQQSVRELCMATQAPEEEERGFFMFQEEDLLERLR